MYWERGDVLLAGAIEILSPSNKDRSSERDAFVFKCLAYLQQGIGMMMIDVVRTRRANLHRELLQRLLPGAAEETMAPDLYTSAYRPVPRDGENQVEVWEQALALHDKMPTMPLFLRGTDAIAVDLETTYERTCQMLRISSNGA